MSLGVALMDASLEKPGLQLGSITWIPVSNLIPCDFGRSRSRSSTVPNLIPYVQRVQSRAHASKNSTSWLILALYVEGIGLNKGGWKKIRHLH